VVAGAFRFTPLGIILHGSRSGLAGNSTAAEYAGTARYAVNEPGGLGWHCTIGDDRIAVHMSYTAWGWHARGCSSLYLGVEFAQPVEAAAISDGQVRAFCWFFQQAQKQWPTLPMNFPTHAELDGSAAYGVYDGKTDTFSRGSSRTTDLRQRIMATLG
jgi:N-acetylmuramoyl-L-alanine amidase